MNLFRQEVIKHQSDKLFGEVILIRPLSFAFLTALLVVFVAVVLVFLLYGKYGRKETVGGFLLPDKGLVNVYAPYLGITQEVFIKEGQTVKQGQILYRVSTDFKMSNNSSNNEKMLEHIEKQKANLVKKIELEKIRFTDEEQSLKEQLKYLDAEIAQIKLQLKTAQLELNLSEKLWNDYKDFRKKDLVLESELTQKHYNYLAKLSTLQNIRQNLINKTANLETIKLNLSQLPNNQAISLQELRNQQLAIEEKITNIKSEKSYDIVSPLDAKVSVLMAKLGQKIDLNAPLLTLLPENSILEAELFLPSRSIGFAEIGQEVLMRYDAFPYQRYGLAKGTIKEISQTVINPQDIHISIGLNEPVYRVKVDLAKQFIFANGKPIFLQPGMKLSADILLENRSLFEWLLEPIYSLKGSI